MEPRAFRWKPAAVSALIGLLCGAGIGVAWSSLVVWWMSVPYLKSEHRRLYDAFERQKVICAGQDLKVGHVLAIEDLALVGVVRSTAVFPRLIKLDDLQSVIGRRLRYDVAGAEPLLWTDLDEVPADAPSTNRPSGTGLATGLGT